MLTVLDSHFRVLGQTEPHALNAFLLARGKKLHSELLPELVLAVDAFKDTERPIPHQVVQIHQETQFKNQTAPILKQGTASVLVILKSCFARTQLNLEAVLGELVEALGDCRLAHGPAKHGGQLVAIIAPLIDQSTGEGCC
jgi:hypothetical protein